MCPNQNYAFSLCQCTVEVFGADKTHVVQHAFVLTPPANSNFNKGYEEMFKITAHHGVAIITGHVRVAQREIHIGNAATRMIESKSNTAKHSKDL